jgi:hypothetical protein
MLNTLTHFLMLIDLYINLISVIVYCMNSKMYRTQSKHPNCYTTDAVQINITQFRTHQMVDVRHLSSFEMLPTHLLTRTILRLSWFHVVSIYIHETPSIYFPTAHNMLDHGIHGIYLFHSSNYRTEFLDFLLIKTSY